MFLLASTWQLRTLEQRRIKPGVPNLQDLMLDDLGGADVIIIEKKSKKNLIHLDHLEPILLTHSMEKWSSTRPAPGA